MRKVNGRWVVVGGQTSADLVPFVRPSAGGGGGGGRGKPKPRPAQKKLGEQAVLNGKTVVWAGDRYGWQSPGSYQKLTNGLQLLPDFIGSGLLSFGQQLRSRPLQTVNRLINPLMGARQGALGVIGAADNAARAGNALYQRHVEKKPQADAAGGAAPVLDRLVDTAYQALGATPPSQMSPRQRDRDMLNRSVTLNVGLGAVAPLRFGALGAQTLAGGVVRGGAAWATNEVLSNYLDDNTQGHMGHLLEAATGIRTPFNFEPGTRDLVDSANASLIPNALAGLGLGAAAGAAGAGFRNIRRRTAAGRTAERQLQARGDLDADGLTQKAEDGSRAFTPQEQQPAPDATPMEAWQQANAEMERRLGMQAEADAPAAAAAPEAPAAPPAAAIPSMPADAPFGKTQPQELPTANAEVDPWDIDYDPALPEADVVKVQLDELDDAELVQLVSGSEPVVEGINTALETRPDAELNPNLRVDAVAVPTDRLSNLYMEGSGELEPWRKAIDALDDVQLRSLASPANSPELFSKVQELTGGEWEQFTKRDILDGIRALSDEDGLTVVTNRLTGQEWVRTSEIDAEPETFQYKDGVNAQGEQIGQSLTGATQWDPISEGVLEVWRSPVDGRLKVVNGHNRLALANRLGVPSVPVREIVATTPESARAQGAIANINAGQGTPFDAAKFIRGTNIKDEKGLRAAGLQVDSGYGKQGLALSKLPDDVLQAAVNDQIKLRQAVLIGESGLDEESMRSAYRYVVQKGRDEVREGALREMLDMAKSAPKVSADQPDIFKGTEWAQTFNEGMLAKGELAAAARSMLASDRRFFGGMGSKRNTGRIEMVGAVDQSAAKDIGSEATRALAIFDLIKYQTGPVSTLLDEGAARIVAGEKASAVAQQIKNRLAASIKEAMGKDPAGAAEDVIQEDMLAAAAPAADAPMAPPKLTAAERRELQKQAMQKAIANGEVRPPVTPIPELPEPASARLTEAAADLEAQGAVPGSKAAQALADELRLATEHAKNDANTAWVQEEALRDAVGYEEYTFEQKKDLGLVEGWDDDTPLLPDSQEIINELTDMAGSLGDSARKSAQNAQRMYEQVAGIEDFETGRPVVDRIVPGPTRPVPLRLTQAAEQPEFQLPAELSKSQPRYGRGTITFQSDLDRAAYVLANDAVKPSKAAPKFRAALEAAGMDIAEVVAHGKQVKAAIKQAAGGGAAPQKAMEINLPPQPWSGSMADDMALKGWDSVGEMPGADPATRQQRQAMALEIIRKVAGPDVEVRFEDQYLSKVRGAEWGGDGKSMALHGGLYRLSEDLIIVRGVLQGDEKVVAEAAFHESFHRLQYLALGTKEAKVMDSLWSRMKVAIASNHVDGSPNTGKPIAYSESQAVAFQRYAEARRNGKDPVVALLGGYEPDAPLAQKAVARIVSAFDRVADLAEKLFNRLALGTFDSTKGIFERARRGALVQQADFAFEEPMSGLHMMQRREGWRRRSWDLRSIPSKASDALVIREIQAKNQAIAEIRRKATEEGC
jgi:hypothetical protein